MQACDTYCPCDNSCIHKGSFFSPHAYRSDSKGQQRDADVLLRALVEAEIDGVAVTNQLTALKETTDSFAKVNVAPHDHFEYSTVALADVDSVCWT